jgi:ubiquinol-cytochrome c reductase iron-sulfur subunit
MRANSSARWVATFFGISLVASLTLTVVYALGGQTQLEGLGLGIALGSLGIGLIIWAKAFLPIGGQVQMREALEPDPEEEDAAEEALEKGAHEIGRRRFLVRIGGAAAASLGVAALFPIRSLGGRPGLELVKTAWGDGVKVVDSDGNLVTADEVGEGEVKTVFPQGHVGSGDAVAVLIGLPPGANEPIPGREGWSLGGLVAYSKLCTHVGCPVGLYEPTRRLLFCPCHQSVFDIPIGARPIGGPATRALPQLPLGVDQNGFLIAKGDFSEAPGPGFWWRPGHD